MRVSRVRYACFALFLYELQPGTLTLKHQQPGKPPREYILNEEDFEADAIKVEDQFGTRSRPGLDASAVGLQLHLIKNEGQLRLTYEGEHGGMVEWCFNGMEVESGSRVTASAFTQTQADPTQCSTCGAEKTDRSAVSDVETQTKPRDFQDANTQTQIGQVQGSNTQTDMVLFESVGSSPSPNTSIDTKCNVDTHLSSSSPSSESRNSLKRKACEPSPSPISYDKRAKSSHDSDPWPRHLYMTCYRTFPIFKGEEGVLHIDLQQGTIWFEGWYGRDHSRVFERKQIDIRDSTTCLKHYQLTCYNNIDNATHCLELSRLNARCDKMGLFIAQCGAPNWKMWSLDENEENYTLVCIKTIIDAIVHCIDRASGRDAVHDPDKYFELERDLVRYSDLQKKRMLTRSDTERWEFTIQELEIQDRLRKSLVSIEEDSAVAVTSTKLEWARQAHNLRDYESCAGDVAGQQS